MFDKNNMGDVLPKDTEYIDSDDYFPVDVVFAFHVLEHLDNPEEMIREFSKSKVFIFATPNHELLEDSIHHYVLMEMRVFKRIFEELNIPAFLRFSKTNPLDIHGIVINSPEKYKKAMESEFFTDNFILHTNMVEPSFRSS